MLVEREGKIVTRARFNAESTYHLQATGDLEAACAVLTQWVEAFPHDLIARNNFAGCLGGLGEPDRAFGESREAARLLPSPFTYWMWIGRSIHADRLAEAETALDDARGRGFDSPLLRDLQAYLAFFRNDDAALQQVWTWAEEARGTSRGQWKGDGRGGSRPVSCRPPHAGDRDCDEHRCELCARNGAHADHGRPANVGAPHEHDEQASRATAHERIARGPNRTHRRGHRATDALRLEFPLDTIVREFGLPLIDATVRLHLNDPAGAVAALEPATKYNLSYTNGIFPPCILVRLRDGLLPDERVRCSGGRVSEDPDSPRPGWPLGVRSTGQAPSGENTARNG